MPLGSDEITESPPLATDHRSRPPPPSRRKAVLRAVGLIAVVVAWLAIAGVGGPAIGSLSTVQSNDQESFLPGGAESVQAANAAAAFEDSGALPAFVIFETDGGAATPEQLASWKHVHPDAGRAAGEPGEARRWAPSATTWWPARYPVSRCRSRWSRPRTGRPRWSWSRCRRTR